MIARRRSHAAQAGLVRGCCFGLILLVVLVVGGIVVGSKALAAPDLGAAPGGTVHGSSQAVIAAALGGDAATQLLAKDHAVVTVSERDLTVIASARNPSPDRFRNPQARIRNGEVVVSADTSVGPFGVTAVAWYQLIFNNSTASTQVTAQADKYAVGQLGLPGFIGDRLNPRGSTSLNLTALFAANPALQALSRALDCVAVQPDGVHIGFHRPGVAASPGMCGV
jgi:hypothetical protein